MDYKNLISKLDNDKKEKKPKKKTEKQLFKIKKPSLKRKYP